MPTAARLFGAVMTGALGWYVSDLVRPLLPEATVFGWFNHVNLVLGALVGWRVIGRHAGKGNGIAVSNGVTAIAVLVVWAVGLQALNEMLRLSMRRVYDGPFEGLEDMFRIALEYGALLLTPSVGLSLVIGGIFIALVVEAINRVWR
ncbi:MAG: TrgA family protein [Thalassovita sp.]